jgi:hypothetical protein
MITVYIEQETDKNFEKVKYVIEYLLDMSGFSWKYIGKDADISINDVFVYYGAKMPEQAFIDWIVEENSFIYIPYVKDFYEPGFYSSENLNYLLKSIKYSAIIPFISDNRDTKLPIKIISFEDKKYCLYDFDLIGNLYFQLSEDNRNSLKKNKGNEHINVQELGFKDFFNIPYVNHYVDLFYFVVKELLESKQQWQLKRCSWPNNQPFGAIISHDLDKLVKWNFISFISNISESLIHIIKFRFSILFKNMWSFIKYIFTNIEEYWNFYEISKIEKKHNFNSTWFVGVNKKHADKFDYNYEDEDVIKELKNLMENGAEIALLSNAKNISLNDLKNEYDILSNITNKKRMGIRHDEYYYTNNAFDGYHLEINALYSSSRKLNIKNAFYNGIASYYSIFNENKDPKTEYINEIPINFYDKNLKIGKYKNIEYKDAQLLMKEMINLTKKVTGLLHLQFTNSLFNEINYMPKLLEYLVDVLKDQNAYVNTCENIIDWFKKRRKIEIIEDINKISLRFNENIPEITFEMIGSKSIHNVYGGNCEYDQRFVKFVNVSAGLEVEISLHDI